MLESNIYRIKVSQKGVTEQTHWYVTSVSVLKATLKMFEDLWARDDYIRLDLTDISATKEALYLTDTWLHEYVRSSGFFSKLYEIVFGYFDPINIFFDYKNK